MTSPGELPDLRTRTRRAVGAEIRKAAMQLFLERGFDATTVDQIAEAAGISRRSFFHYFPTKEDVVFGDLAALGETLRAALEARPATESAWDALRAALKTLGPADPSPEVTLAIARMYRDTPSLRARHLEKHLRWQELLAPDITRRLPTRRRAGPDPRPRAIIAAALACLDIAIDAWLESGGRADPEQLWDEAVAAVRA